MPKPLNFRQGALYALGIAILILLVAIGLVALAAWEDPIIALQIEQTSWREFALVALLIVLGSLAVAVKWLGMMAWQQRQGGKFRSWGIRWPW